MKNINKNKFLIIIFFIIFIISKAYFFSNKYKEDKYISNAYVFIESLKSITDTSVKYIGKIVEEGDNDNIKFKDKFIIKIYLNEETNLDKWEEYTSYTNGDVIKINGKIQIPEIMNNPGEFKYKYYLYSNNIYGEITVNKIIQKEEYELNSKERIINSIYRYKEYLGDKLDSNMTKENAAIAKSIIYGDTIDVDARIEENFEKAGVSHMMAISGSNIIGLITVMMITFKVVKLNKKLSKMINILVITVYIILTGASLSTLRAGIMCIICTVNIIIGENGGNKKSSFNNLLLTIVIILLYSPFCIYNTGFILSILATTGIILFNPYITNFKVKTLSKVKNNILKNALDIFLSNLSLTLTVQMVILPVQINSFNYISLTSILSNVFCSFLSSILTVLGSIYIFTSYIPMLSNILVFFIQIFVCILCFSISVFSKLSIEIKVMDLNILSITTYYIFVFLIYLRMYLKRIYKGRRKTNFKSYTIFQVICLVICIVLIVFSNLHFKYIDSFVYFFNVGQGELSLIKSKENVLIVDIGSLKTNLAYNTIDSYCKMKNIQNVDAIVLSHMHSDHINGLERFVKEYRVGEIIYAKPFEENEEYFKFLDLVKEYNLNVREIISGESIQYGDVNINILLPDNIKIENKEDKEGTNTNSLICKISINDMDILYMGDATNKTEEKLIKKYEVDEEIFKDIELLKVGHHGSKTSSSEKFVKLVKPKYAIISAKKSYYNHPHESVIETLEKYKIEIYLTENQGAIKFNLYNFLKKQHNILKDR